MAVEGPGNSLWVYWQTPDAQWHGPLGVGAPGSTFSSPSLALGANGLPTIAVQGPGHSLWVYWQTPDAQWHGPLGVGNPGSTFSSPSLAFGTTGLPTVAVQGPGNSLWVYWETADAQWHGPLGVGDPGSAYSSPSLAFDTSGLPTVAVQGPGHSLWAYWETGDAQWHGPLGVGDPGSTFSSPSLGFDDSGLPTVAVQGPGHSLWAYWETGDAQWHGPLGVGDPGSTFSSPSLGFDDSGLPTVAVQGPGNSLWVYWETGDAQWHGPLGVGNPGSTFSSPSLGFDDSGLPTVAVQGPGNSLWAYWETGDAQWHGPLGVGNPGSTYSSPSEGTSFPTEAGSGPGGQLDGKVVTIDPGHNGGNGSDPAYIDAPIWNGVGYEPCDTAGTATDSGYTEAQFNFDVAEYLAADLGSEGATVVLTRTTNTGVGPCVDQRAAIGNDAHSSVAISIHADGGPPSGRGFSISEPVADGINNAVIAPSEAFGLAVRSAFSQTGMPVSDYYAVDGIAPRNDLGGLNLTTVPKVLIECGNMRNATDAGLLTSDTWQQEAAGALASAITTFLTSS